METNTTKNYVLCLPSGSHDRAVLLYEYVGKKTVDLQHTEVPDAYRGRGIAKHLAKVKLVTGVIFHLSSSGEERGSFSVRYFLFYSTNLLYVDLIFK